jgi:hypothetical protein
LSAYPGSGNVAADLISGFDSVVLAAMVVMQSDNLDYTAIEAFNVAEPTDFAAVVTSQITNNVGLNTSPNMPAFLSVTYRYARQAVGTRYGYKRISGITDDSVSGSSINPLYQATLSSVGTALGSVLSPIVGVEFTPFIASRPITLGVNPGGYKTTSCSVNGLGTQNTRKR